MNLSRLKILDFSTLLPGPYASLMLADMGAQVLRISAKSRPDLVLHQPPYIGDGSINANGAWLGRNKDTMFLNLKKPESIEIVKRLIKEEGYTIILEQFRPGVMDKLGLGYETLKEICPELIYCSLTGYGQTGPYRDKAGHDINYLALSGLMSHSCRQGETPSLYGVQIADLAIGSYSVIRILAAVEHRNRTGKGQWIDVAMLDGLIPFNSLVGAGFLVDGKEPGKETHLLNGGSAYDFYLTADNQVLSVGSLEPKFWKRFCETIGKPEWIEAGVDAEDIQEKKEEIRSIIAGKTRGRWEEAFRDKDACVESVSSLEEALLKDPHIAARELVISIDCQGETIKQPAMPIHFSDSAPVYRHSGKPAGVDTKAVLEQLGYSEEAIEALKAKGCFD